MEVLSDDEILAKYAEDPATEYLATLFIRHQKAMLLVALGLLKDLPEAEDALMDIFIKLKEKGLPPHIFSLKSWMLSVTRNHCLDRLRKKGGKTTLSLDAFMDFGEELRLDDKTGKEFKLNLIANCLQKLPASQKECLELFYEQKKTYKEIAASQGMALNQVKSHLQNAIRNLRVCVSKEGGQWAGNA
jgi:RNA polymerase sigma-70 factor (ECF subfamily)